MYIPGQTIRCPFHTRLLIILALSMLDSRALSESWSCAGTTRRRCADVQHKSVIAGINDEELRGNIVCRPPPPPCKKKTLALFGLLSDFPE